MKKLFKIFSILLLLSFVIVSCQDEELLETNNPTWESAVHGFGQKASGSADNFTYQDANTDIDFEFQWVSIEGANTVTRAEVYVYFNEEYVDSDGNIKTAGHGGDDGELYLTLEGGSLGGNRENVSFSVSQADVFALYTGSRFDYENGNGEVDVFNNPAKPERNSTDRFVPGDSFSIRWELTTDDGRVFSAWSPSVCTEVPGANCSVAWTVVCATEIADPPGTYTLDMQDSYGDGWNGAAVRVIVDGVATDYTLDDYTTDGGSTGSVDIVVPPGTSTLTFEYVSGDWDSEVSFQVTAPWGKTIISETPSPLEGPLTLDLCP